MNRIRLHAPAKINLALDVVGERSDGYHELRMVMQMTDLYDRIEIKGREDDRIVLHCNVPDLPCDDRNIAYRAAALMTERFCPGEGVEIHIEKHIPVAGGLAGGSTDCAAVLRGMNELLSLGLRDRELSELGLSLGADVPFCLMGGTALSEGVGEKLTPLRALPDCHILLANPPVSVSTAHVYQNLAPARSLKHPDIDGMAAALERGDLAGVCDKMGNVLETVTIREHPLVQSIKDRIHEAGALGVLMSGSGPTVFGIFDDRDKAKRACRDMEEASLASRIFLTSPNG